MVKFICDHPAVVVQILAILGSFAILLTGSLVAILTWVFKKELRNIHQLFMTLEKKIDQATERHYECQKQLTVKYVSYEDFDRFLKTRSEEWAEFRQDFKEFTNNFWKHTHQSNGKPEV